MELLPKYVSCASSQKLLHFEDVPIKSLKQLLYSLEFIRRRASEKKFKSAF